MQMQSRVDRAKRSLQVVLLLISTLLLPPGYAIGIADISLSEAQRVFDDISHISSPDGNSAVRQAYAGGKLRGYLFLSNEIAPIPAYSGKPISVLIGLQPDARISGISILAHEEPILVIGVTDEDLAGFTDQYSNQLATSRIRVGAHNREGYVGIDGISGATITAMVLNRTIMRSAQRVAGFYQLPRPVTPKVEAPQPAVENEISSSVAESSSLDSVPGRQIPASVARESPPAPPLLEDNPEPQGEPASTPASKVPPPGPDAATAVVEEEHWFDLELVWQEKGVELTIIAAALAVLLFILFFQDWLVVRTRLFRRLRLAYLLFTVFFIGYYCMAQLSIVNVLAFIQLLVNQFTWETLMVDPLIFVLWGFVAVSIILWGRGVYCGWLCPFGAMQELIHKAGEKIGLKSYEFPQMVHERLWAIKYIVLILLVGVSLESLAMASVIAEIEPFKTTFALGFQREWWFVAYALALLVISAFNSKFFCKYLCPLGAGLSFATRFRVFDWLRRRKECGRPCQTCSAQCQISAIKHTGEIIDTECHYCLECQVDYWDDQLCPPLIDKRKKRERRAKRNQQQIESRLID